jgi:hypothetical protein
MGIALVFLVLEIKSLQTTLAHDSLLPLLTEAVETCRGQAKLMELIEGIAAQFQTDHGLSMKDAINRIDKAAKEQHEAAELLKTGVKEDRHKAELDRDQLQRLLIELHRISLKVETGIATSDRIEHAAKGVAQDLSDAHKRADEVQGGAHGAAADAASQQTQKEKRIEKEKEND